MLQGDTQGLGWLPITQTRGLRPADVPACTVWVLGTLEAGTGPQVFSQLMKTVPLYEPKDAPSRQACPFCPFIPRQELFLAPESQTNGEKLPPRAQSFSLEQGKYRDSQSAGSSVAHS